MSSIRLNGEPSPLSVRSLSELLETRGCLHQGGLAVAVNGAVVPRSAWSGLVLRDGDTVEVVGAVQGG